MNKSGTRSLVKGVCIVAVLAVIAIPLSSLMVAQAPVDTTPHVTAKVAPQAVATIDESQEVETSSAVSALMAGSAVGPSRAAIIDLRHPASAFVP